MEETLGKRIAAHRKRLGMTQDALAELLGVTAQAVSKWENDQSCPDIAMLPKLAEIFGITTDELLGLQRKDVHIAEIIQEDKMNAGHEPEGAENRSKWDTLKSPGAAFACWLFLTGLVAAVDVFRSTPISFWDIAIAAGIFIFGLFGFFRKFSVLRLACAIGGGCFLIELIFSAQIAGISWELPLAIGLALFGLDLLIDTIRNPKKKAFPVGHIGKEAKSHCTIEGGSFDCVTAFGEDHRLIQLPRLSGGSARVSFGSLEIDLSGCGEISDGCAMDVGCSFGETEILVPKECRVVSDIRTFFGAAEMRGNPSPETAAVMNISGSVSFGEITIRYI